MRGVWRGEVGLRVPGICLGGGGVSFGGVVGCG